MIVGRCDRCNGWRKSSLRRSFHRTTLFPTLISRDDRYVFGIFFIVFVVVNLFFLHFFSVREAFWSDTRRVGIVRAAVGSHNCVYKYDFTASQTCCRAIVNKTVNKHAVVT